MNMFEMMKLLPKLGAVLALLKELPLLVNEAQRLLKQVEAAMKVAEEATGQDLAAGKKALEQVVAFLETIEDGVENILGPVVKDDVK